MTSSLALLNRRESSVNARLKVLLNALSARSGGGQTYVRNLLSFLPENAPFDIFVLCPDSLALPNDRENIRRIPVKWPVQNPFARALWERIYLPRLLRRLAADVLFCPGGIFGGPVPVGCKKVATFQNMIPFDPVQRRKYPLGYMRLRNWILRRAMFRSMVSADLVICLSKFARSVLEECSAGKLKNTVVIPHGLGPQFRTSEAGRLPRPPWLPPGDYILYASSIDHYKNQAEVVEAYAIVKEKRQTQEKLIFVGPESLDYGQKVRALIKRLGLGSDILLLGVVPYSEMPALYHNARLNVFASESENCPNILLEAMAAGRPVLVSNRPPMPEFGGDAVIYFDPSSPEGLAEKLVCVLDDPARMAELSAKAVERSQLYDWESTAACTWTLMENLVRSRNTSSNPEVQIGDNSNSKTRVAPTSEI